MNEEDGHTIHASRENYGLCIGEGIPGPRLAHLQPRSVHHSQCDHLKINIKKYISHILHRKNPSNYINESCMCCEKTFLFECPDSNETNPHKSKDRNRLNCTCQDCHGKVSTNFCGEGCKCIQIMQNWILENTDLLKGKGDAETNKDSLWWKFNSLKKTPQERGKCTKENDKAEPKRRSFRSNVCLEHPRRPKFNTETIFENTALNNTSSEQECNQKGCKHFGGDAYNCSEHKPTKVYFCPVVRKMLFKKEAVRSKRDAVRNTSIKEICRLHRMTTSKFIQTEPSPIKNSKIIQTESTGTDDADLQKNQPKCECINNCFKCNLNQWRVPKVSNKMCGEQAQALCFPKALMESSAFACPYSYLNHFVIHSLHGSNCPQFKGKKKKEKIRGNENEEVNPDIHFHHNELRKWGYHPLIRRKEKPTTEKNEVKKPKKCFLKTTSDEDCIHCQDQSKYFRHFKVKKYFQRRECPASSVKNNFANHLPHHFTPKYRNFLNSETSFHEAVATKELWENLGPFRYKSVSKENLNESSFEEQCSPRNKDYCGSQIKRFDSMVETPVTVTYERDKHKKDTPTTVKFLNKYVSSEESRTYGLVRDCKETIRAGRKRKRLFTTYANRRKKLITNKKSSKLEPQILKELSQNRKNKMTQIEKSEEGSPAVSPRVISPQTKRLFFRHAGNSKKTTEPVEDTPRNHVKVPTGTVEYSDKFANHQSNVKKKLVEVLPKKEFAVFANQTDSSENRNLMLQCGTQCEEVVEKCSPRSETWSSNHLKRA